MSNATDSMKGTAKKVEPKFFHSWEMKGKPGMYDTNYRCMYCEKTHSVSIDNPESELPKYGCIDIKKKRVWGLDGNKVPTYDPDEIVEIPKKVDPNFSNWGAYELPEHTIEAFLASDAGPEAVISFTKKELEDWAKKLISPDYLSFERWNEERKLKELRDSCNKE